MTVRSRNVVRGGDAQELWSTVASKQDSAMKTSRGFALLLVLPFLNIPLLADPPHSIECLMRDQFPTVSLDARAVENSDLRVRYPSSYDEVFVAEIGDQRVALRAVGAHFSVAAESNGKLFYTSAHD